jgi:hypothetical protein
MARFSAVQQGRDDMSMIGAGRFRAMVATTWTGICKRTVEDGLIWRFFIALPSGAAKSV